MAFVFVIVLALLPGIIAEQRNHRYPLAVTIVGFASLWFHPALWLGAMLWAWKGATKAPAA